MPKKNKHKPKEGSNDIKVNTPNIQNKETFQRMNYLYQAASLSTLQNQDSLAHFYANTLRSIGKKNVLRLDPSIKRSICVRCDAILIPAISSNARFKKRGGRYARVMTCDKCKSVKSMPLDDPSYELYHDKSEHQVVQLIDSNQIPLNVTPKTIQEEDIL